MGIVLFSLDAQYDGRHDCLSCHTTLMRYLLLFDNSDVDSRSSYNRLLKVIYTHLTYWQKICISVASITNESVVVAFQS